MKTQISDPQKLTIETTECNLESTESVADNLKEYPDSTDIHMVSPKPEKIYSASQSTSQQNKLFTLKKKVSEFKTLAQKALDSPKLGLVSAAKTDIYDAQIYDFLGVTSNSSTALAKNHSKDSIASDIFARKNSFNDNASISSSISPQSTSYNRYKKSSDTVSKTVPLKKNKSVLSVIPPIVNKNSATSDHFVVPGNAPESPLLDSATNLNKYACNQTVKLRLNSRFATMFQRPSSAAISSSPRTNFSARSFDPHYNRNQSDLNLSVLPSPTTDTSKLETSPNLKSDANNISQKNIYQRFQKDITKINGQKKSHPKFSPLSTTKGVYKDFFSPTSFSRNTKNISKLKTQNTLAELRQSENADSNDAQTDSTPLSLGKSIPSQENCFEKPPAAEPIPNISVTNSNNDDKSSDNNKYVLEHDTPNYKNPNFGSKPSNKIGKLEIEELFSDLKMDQNATRPINVFSKSNDTRSISIGSLDKQYVYIDSLRNTTSPKSTV
ncbi:hypothetical protein BB561_006632 [Smittium simulii]|uniref:Uncharacterized protein n=1 Tax=Smittium simulii TaxID=133385 RepID=A0A2T9Y2Y6_9FUNG|nr:hypothetical protein BB561_006632 [Smittium simulii]